MVMHIHENDKDRLKNAVRGTAWVGDDVKILFKVEDGELIVLTHDCDEEHVVKLIELLLMGRYKRLSYDGTLFHRMSNVADVMAMKRKLKVTTA